MPLVQTFIALLLMIEHLHKNRSHNHKIDQIMQGTSPTDVILLAQYIKYILSLMTFDIYSQWYQSVSSGMTVSVMSSSLRLTSTESAAPLWTASLTSCVVCTGRPLMPMMTSWLVMPALWTEQHSTSLAHKALLKRAQPSWEISHPQEKHHWPLDMSVHVSGSFPTRGKVNNVSGWVVAS